MLNIRVAEPEVELRPRITVVGTGGAGINAVNNMIRSDLQGVEFLACNTDAQSLKMSLSERKLQLGGHVTRGLGAGARPEVGRAATEEVLDDIMGYLEGSNMVFITAGMGGGTGTGSAPVIARAAKEAGILTVGVVTKPFHFEGAHRMRLAEQGIEELQQHVDTLLIIPNQNLFRIANEKTTFADAFKMADEVLHAGVRGVTDLIVMPGLINLDFNDIRSVMSEMGKAMMGTGEATGDRRATEAAEAAINNPLLEDASMQGARGLLINITGGMDMTLFEVDEACNRIRNEVDPDANIIFGSTFNPELEGKIRVSVVATGIDNGVRARQPIGTGAPTVSTGFAHEVAANPASRQTFPPAAQFGRGVTLRSGQTAAAQVPLTNTQQPASIGTPMAQPRTGTTATATAQPVRAHAPQAPAYGYARGSAATAMKVEEQFEPMTVGVLEEQTVESFQAVAEELHYPQTAAPASAASQRGERDGDSFIPPMPVMTETKIVTSPAASSYVGAPAVTAPTATPVPAQPVSHAASATSEKRPSLFDRLTGNASARANPPVAPAAAPVAVTPTTVTTQAQPALAVDNSDRMPVQSSFDDDLDIPAFLRRQAS